MAIHPGSSVQNYDNWWFWIRKTKRIAQFNKREQYKRDFIDNIYLYVGDLNKPKYQFFIEKDENEGIRHFNNPNAFIECSNTMDDVYENIDDYNVIRKREKIIVFDDMIADIMTNRRFQAIIKELFIRCRKLKFHLFLSCNLIFLFQKMSD